MVDLDNPVLLERYLDGELPADELAAVEAAIAVSPRHQEQVEEHHAIREALREASAHAVAQAPLEGLWERISAEIDAQAPRVPVGPPSLVERLRVWWTTPRLAVALGVAAALVVGGLWLARQAPPSAPPAPAETARDDHRLIVESYEVTSGTVVIDVDPEDADAPAVVWHFVDEDRRI